MTQIYSFPPVSSEGVKVLILGSMPGKASLAANQYYAHPRNLFWTMMETIIGVRSDLPYAARCEALTRRGVAMWDVLKACTRAGSLDSNIIDASIAPNDFEQFFRTHSGIRAVYFNGAKAEQVYLRHVLPNLSNAFSGVATKRLPSTSPANASIPLPEKFAQWKTIASTLGPVDTAA